MKLTASSLVADDSTVDVRDLDRDGAISRIEEAWKVVEKKRHRRLNVLVRHDDDELQTSRKNSTFHLMEDLEKYAALQVLSLLLDWRTNDVFYFI